jgi:hypothetical protein
MRRQYRDFDIHEPDFERHPPTFRKHKVKVKVKKDNRHERPRDDQMPVQSHDQDR